ncbi:MAG: DUF1211 domain-containing protein [Anaerolineae bacterium]|nr:DUF1211 domain-containing protein [Anaerolineae bacterium]
MQPPPTQPLVAEVTETSRLEAFSDGVFAIAITLLVLEIRLPSTVDAGKAGTLANALFQLWPVYLAYVTSFLTIAIMWANHHTMFKMIRRTDRSLMLLNAVLLMVITFLNFPTVVVAEYFQKPDAGVAAVFYSGSLLVTGIFFNGLWLYVVRQPHLLEPSITMSNARRVLRQYSVGLVVYAIAMGVAFFSAPASVVMCLLVGVFFALPIRRRAAIVE